MRMIVLYIPLALLGSRLFALRGIFAAATLANIVTAGLSLVWLRSAIPRPGSADASGEGGAAAGRKAADIA